MTKKYTLKELKQVNEYYSSKQGKIYEKIFEKGLDKIKDEILKVEISRAKKLVAELNKKFKSEGFEFEYLDTEIEFEMYKKSKIATLKTEIDISGDEYEYSSSGVKDGVHNVVEKTFGEVINDYDYAIEVGNSFNTRLI